MKQIVYQSKLAINVGGLAKMRSLKMRRGIADTSGLWSMPVNRAVSRP
jgi:hypothetical protein